MEQQMTGYPSIDKPWLKYYSEEAINAPLPEMTMYQYIWENNKDHLSDVALRYYGTRITYGKLFEQIKKAASAFYSMGVRAGDIVTIMSMHTPETIVCIYALNYIGAVANMVYMTLAEKEILHTLDNTESKMFFVLDAALQRVNKLKDEITVPIVVLDISDSMLPHMKLGYKLKAKPPKHSFMGWNSFLSHSAAPAPMAADHAAPAIIVYTSGTTGEPKGVVLACINLNSLVEQLKYTDRNYQREETALLSIPPFVGFGIGMMHLCLGTGQDTALGIAQNADAMGKLFNQIKPNRFVSGPPVLEAIMRHTHGDLSRTIDFTGGGEAISPEKEDAFNEFLKAHHSNTQYLSGYGMSEFASVVTMNMRYAYKQGSVGIPLVKANVRVVDTDSGKELKYGESGELCFAAPNTMIGYYKNSSATDATIETDHKGKRWLHTADVGYVDEDGFIYIIGRLKRVYLSQTESGGILKIYPTRIENVILQNPYVKSCGVIVRKDSERLNVPVAFITVKDNLSDDSSSILAELRTLIEQELPEYDRPDSINIIHEMPLTPSGKINYRTLENEAIKGE